MFVLLFAEHELVSLRQSRQLERYPGESCPLADAGAGHTGEYTEVKTGEHNGKKDRNNKRKF